MDENGVALLLDVAWEQSETARRAALDWWNAKGANDVEPGAIYGRRLVMALWELYETVDRIRSMSPPDQHEPIGRLLGLFLAKLGKVDRDGLYFAARATWHRADATVGGPTAAYFGGPPVTSSTATVSRMDVPGWAEIASSSDEWHAAYVVDDVTITLVGQNPDRRVTIAADAAHEAASELADSLAHFIGSNEAG